MNGNIARGGEMCFRVNRANCQCSLKLVSGYKPLIISKRKLSTSCLPTYYLMTDLVVTGGKLFSFLPPFPSCDSNSEMPLGSACQLGERVTHSMQLSCLWPLLAAFLLNPKRPQVLFFSFSGKWKTYFPSWKVHINSQRVIASATSTLTLAFWTLTNVTKGSIICFLGRQCILWEIIYVSPWHRAS